MPTGYSREETRRFWRLHSRQWEDLDRSIDPDGLTNVCFEGAPLWLNRFSARCQRSTFLKLLEQAGPVTSHRVLDIGCGTGRWSRLLSGLGAHVTGIDLQPETLRVTSRRLPDCRFVEMAADSMAFPAGCFDMAVSVTVVQHIPDEGQAAALREIRRVLADGGTYLMMEGTRDRGPHMFGNSIRAWSEMATSSGFRIEKVVPYDFAPLVYALKRLALSYRTAAGGNDAPPPVEEFVARSRPANADRGISKRIYYLALHAATIASYPLEPVCMIGAPASWAYHAGFLLRAI